MDELEGDFFRACKKNRLADVTAMLDAHPQLVARLKQENNAAAYVCLQVNMHGASLPGVEGLQDCLAMVTLLLDRGVEPNTRGNDGVMTALHYAANANDALSQRELVRVLVERGADPEAAIGWDPSLTPMRQQPPPPASVVDLLRNAPAIRREYEEQAAAAETAAAAAVAAADSAQEAVPPIRAMYPGMEPGDIFMKAIRYAREDDVLLLLQDYVDEVINTAASSCTPIENVSMLMHMAPPVTPGLSDDDARRRRYWQDPASGMSMMQILLTHGEDPNRRGSDGSLSAIHYAVSSNDHAL